MKPTFRACMAWLHTWSGLVMGWLLLAITLAGTLSVFRPEISTWMRPELKAHMAVSPDAATQAAIQWLSTHAAHAPTWYLEAANSRAP
ncbi:PepSY-associated TM helix domain-containing protein, partial [Acetobacter tropicalis]